MLDFEYSVKEIHNGDPQTAEEGVANAVALPVLRAVRIVGIVVKLNQNLIGIVLSRNLCGGNGAGIERIERECSLNPIVAPDYGKSVYAAVINIDAGIAVDIRCAGGNELTLAVCNLDFCVAEILTKRIKNAKVDYIYLFALRILCKDMDFGTLFCSVVYAGEVLEIYFNTVLKHPFVKEGVDICVILRSALNGGFILSSSAIGNFFSAEL